MMNNHESGSPISALKQIQDVFKAAPATALHLLYQENNKTLFERVKAFMDDIAEFHIDELGDLLPQIDLHDLATWLSMNETAFENDVIKALRQVLATSYTALNIDRHVMPVIQYSNTTMEISSEVVSAAIENHIEPITLIHYGSKIGRKECIRFMGAMINHETNGINSLGILVLDELFAELISNFEKNGLPVFSAKH